MFHEGDLGSGIAASLAQQKLLTCFIYAEDDAVSTSWQTCLSRQADLISKKTILLRFTSDSQEAQYLKTFCPVSTTPTIVVLKFGAVVDKLESPLEDHELTARLVTALTSDEMTSTASSADNPAHRPDQSPTIQPILPQPNLQQSQHVAHTQQTEQDQQRASTPNSQTSNTTTSLHNLMPDRAARLEADQAAKQAEEKAARVARAEARRREALEAQTSSSNGRQIADAKELGRAAVRADWVRQQAKRKEQAKLERERILQQIESDRQERKHRASVKSGGVIKTEQSATSSPLRPSTTASTGQTCALQVRLLDGSSVKEQFAPSATLEGDVRTWIKGVADTTAGTPSYSFRLMRPPQPSRTVAKTEEKQTLSSLGFLPSATLVLVASAANKNTNGSFVNNISNLFTAILASIISFFSLFLGIGNSASSSANSNQENPRDSTNGHISNGSSSGADTKVGAAKLRTNTLATARSQQSSDEPTEFYNGNSSAFEARKDNDDEKDR